MSKKDIVFGTSGWRGIIAEEFTFERLRIVSQSIADYINSMPDSSRIIAIGYDTRFLSENFAKVAAEVLAANNIQVYLSHTDVPTPVISHYIIENGLSGGINITASHNPPIYSGIKFSPAWGGPALPETTDLIEAKCKTLSLEPELIKTMEFKKAETENLIEIKDFSKSYLEKVKSIFDLNLIKKNTSLVYDAMYGTGRHYIPKLLSGAKLEVLHANRDAFFGGHRPEPAEEYLVESVEKIKSEKYDIGIATDGDADRFGIVDSTGIFISPNQVLALALYHLYNKGYRGVVARSVMTSSFVDAVAEYLGVEVFETPVGFKYIGDISVKHEMIVGGEESGGLTIGGHVPEKDGIVACLLMAELVSEEGKSLGDILNDLYSKVGNFITLRKNYTLAAEDMALLKKSLETKEISKIDTYKVSKFIKIDGYKYVIDKNTWIGLRFSGTEPVVRVYVESESLDKAKDLLKAAEKTFSIA